ncbi:MAG: hypothetical protein KDA84_30585, partial [Planctomycetaceae bacterium]|nr:hypothetical protein [Planctomycetaceae bacterium]
MRNFTNLQVGLLKLGFVAVVFLVPVESQAVEHPQEKRARIFLQTGGPSATVWRLAFSPDSRVLYVAGADKVVHRWMLPGPAQQFPPRLLTPLRWPFVRGPRGQIYAMSLPEDPQSTEVSIAGFSARDQTSHVFRWNSVTEQVTSVIQDLKMRSVVTSLDYSPQGSKLLVRGQNGELEVVNLPANTIRELPPMKKAEGETPVRFLDNTHLAVPTTNPLAPQQWLVNLRDLNQPDNTAVTLEQIHWYGVAALA